MWLLGGPVAGAQSALPDTLLWEPVGEGVQRSYWLAFDADTLYTGARQIAGDDLAAMAVLYPRANEWVPVPFRASVKDMVFMPNGTIFVYLSKLARSAGSLNAFSEVHDEVRFMLPIETPEGALLVGIKENYAVAARSTDDGLTWTDQGGPQIPSSGMSPLDLLVLPPTTERPNSRIVATGYGGILVSDDDGQTWQSSDVHAEEPTFIAWGGVRIASGLYGGDHGGELLAVVEGNGVGSLVIRSSDGIAWEAVAPFPGQTSFKSDLLAMPDGTVFLYEGFGDNNDRDGRTLWRTADGGNTWKAVGPVWREWSAVPTDLAFGPDGRLWASAEGASTSSKRGGVFRTVEPVYVADDESPVEPGRELHLTVQPNPSRQHVEIAVSGAARERRALVVVDGVGREVARAVGSSWRLDVSSWASGAYYARVEGGGVEPVAFTVVR